MATTGFGILVSELFSTAIFLLTYCKNVIGKSRVKVNCNEKVPLKAPCDTF